MMPQVCRGPEEHILTVTTSASQAGFSQREKESKESYDQRFQGRIPGLAMVLPPTQHRVLGVMVKM